jgi:hypothetical protein
VKIPDEHPFAGMPAPRLDAEDAIAAAPDLSSVEVARIRDAADRADAALDQRRALIDPSLARVWATARESDARTRRRVGV